jgi:hypothetical protein
MGVKIKVNISPNTILRNRHLEDGGAAQLLLANTVLRFAKPYTPFDAGVLSDATISDNGKQIVYSTPYAHYQYEGISKNGNSLNYQGAPMRGKKWIPRMVADRNKDITQEIANFVGGKAK